MKRLLKEDLVEQSRAYFNSYPKTDTFHATEDGMFFTPANRGEAVDHSNRQGLKLHVIKRSDLDEFSIKDKRVLFADLIKSAKRELVESSKWPDIDPAEFLEAAKKNVRLAFDWICDEETAAIHKEVEEAMQIAEKEIKEIERKKGVFADLVKSAKIELKLNRPDRAKPFLSKAYGWIYNQATAKEFNDLEAEIEKAEKELEEQEVAKQPSDAAWLGEVTAPIVVPEEKKETPAQEPPAAPEAAQKEKTVKSKKSK